MWKKLCFTIYIFFISFKTELCPLCMHFLIWFRKSSIVVKNQIKWKVSVAKIWNYLMEKAHWWLLVPLYFQSHILFVRVPTDKLNFDFSYINEKKNHVPCEINTTSVSLVENSSFFLVQITISNGFELMRTESYHNITLIWL